MRLWAQLHPWGHTHSCTHTSEQDHTHIHSLMEVQLCLLRNGYKHMILTGSVSLLSNQSDPSVKLKANHPQMFTDHLMQIINKMKHQIHTHGLTENLIKSTHTFPKMYSGKAWLIIAADIRHFSSYRYRSFFKTDLLIK